MDTLPVTLSGSVDSVVYQNEENGYTVLRLKDGENKIVTVVGNLPFAVTGERLELTGNWAKHPFHGDQFKAETCVRRMPENADDIFAYLSSGIIKGVGPATARDMLDTFGVNVMNVIESEPEKLADIKGITEKRAKDIGEAFRKRASLRRLMDFFAENGIKLRFALRLYKLYGEDSRAALLDNPYILTEEYIGADFAEADALAIRLGFAGDAPERVQAAVVYELAFNAANGHTFIPRERLIPAVCQLISVDAESANEAAESLMDAGMLVIDQVAGREAVYLSAMFAAETGVARRIKVMAARMPGNIRGVEAGPLIADCEAEMGIKLADEQRRAVSAAATSGIMALTGGPGTGKTTTVRAIIRVFDKMGISAALAAPTGRAAKRLSELSGREASTIHRLLETGYDKESARLIFKRDEDDPLDADAVILDETSMVDITLMDALLRAMKPECRLVMVGDCDQLPSVGAGNVFMDVLRSGAVMTVRLTEVFRQAEESAIVKNAHLINTGEMPDLGVNRGDFFFLARRDAQRAVETITELAFKRLPNNMGIEPAQIQVLSPTRRYAAGTVNLNKSLQAVLNPPAEGKNEKEFGDFVFREGDRVMQIRNNYDIIWRKSNGEAGMGVFNGDVGHIVSISSSEQIMTVDFDERQVIYTFEMLPDLEPAYAMTVHKSQGSEYRAVILSLGRCAPTLLSRAILYTAVTRARELLVIVGDAENIKTMVENDKPQRRYSGLKTRLDKNGNI